MIAMEKKEKLLVLILEDLFSDIELIKLQFIELDFDVSFILTHNKNSFEEKLLGEKPDLIIADYTIPGYNGMKALQFLREKDELTPFIFVTGTLGEEKAVAAIKAGATDFVTKNRIDLLPASILRSLRERDEKIQKNAALVEVFERERKFEALIENSSDWVSILTEDHFFIYISSSVSRIMGYHPSDLKTLNYFELVHPDDQALLYEEFNQVKESQELTLSPYRVLDKQKKYRWLDTIIANRLDDTAIGGISVNSRDITETHHQRILDDMAAKIQRIFSSPKKFDTQLQLILRLLKNFGSADYAELWLSDVDGSRMIKRASSFSGADLIPFAQKSKAERASDRKSGILGKVWSARKPTFISNIETNQDINLDELGRKELKSVLGIPLMRGGKSVGTLLYYFRSAIPELDAFYSIMETTNNVLSVELQRRKSEEELEHLFNLSPDILCMMSLEGTIKKISPSVEANMGYLQRELLAKNFEKLLHTDDLKQATLFQRSNLQGKSIHYFESRLITKDGNFKWFAWSAYPLLEEELIIIIGKDIHEKKIIDKTLEEQNTQLKQIAWSQSHEVRAPLARMLSILELINKGNGTDMKVEYIKHLNESANELDSIIRKMVDSTINLNLSLQ